MPLFDDRDIRRNKSKVRKRKRPVLDAPTPKKERLLQLYFPKQTSKWSVRRNDHSGAVVCGNPDPGGGLRTSNLEYQNRRLIMADVLLLTPYNSCYQVFFSKNVAIKFLIAIQRDQNIALKV